LCALNWSRACAAVALLAAASGGGQASEEDAKTATGIAAPDRPGPGPVEGATPLSHAVFHDAVIHFTPDDPELHDTAHIAHEDNGRVAVRTITLPQWRSAMRATAYVTVSPIPDDELSVFDRWDRAGNVRLCPPDMAEIEILRFVTAYGGETDYEVDVSHLAPLLAGDCTFRAFVDTWSSPGWLVDFEIRFDRGNRRPGGAGSAGTGSDGADDADRDVGPPEHPAGPTDGTPVWCRGVFYHEGLTEENLRGGPFEVPVDVPGGADRLLLYYLSSGHCTDGRGADEFVTKDNVISLDGEIVFRFRPWRNDCRRFRSINPYTRRWSDGSWSSDYSRSGWCPGDAVDPLVLDLTDRLGEGRHTLTFGVDGARAADEDGDFGYWRVSAYLVGWKE
jgi:hypothetical protein